MPTRTIYTATVKVPIYVAWKCENCGEINISEGTISCQRQASTTSVRSKKLDATSKEASELVKEAWKKEVLDFIMLPTYNTEKLMHDLEINNKAKCSHCNKKAIWNISTVYDYCTGLTLILGLISGLISFSTGASITSWLIFILCIGVFLWAGISWLICNRKVKHLPEEYVPVIGSFNYELNEYAQKKKIFLPSPDEAIFIASDVCADSIDNSNQFLSDYAKEINSLSKDKVDSSEYSLSEQGDNNAPAKKYGNYNVYGKDIALEKSIPNNDIICPVCGAQLIENAAFCNKCGTKYKSEAKTDSKKSEKNFCRKCGEELFDDSEFCHKCGTKIIKKRS